MRLTDINIKDRPRPIKDAADKLTKWLGVAGSLVLALVGWGVLTAAQGDAVTGLLGAIPGAVNAVTTVLVAFGIRKSAEPLVTPLSDPRDDELRALVALPPNSQLVPKDRGNLTGAAGTTAGESTGRRHGSDHLPQLAADDRDGVLDDITGDDALRPRTWSDPLPADEEPDTRTFGDVPREDCTRIDSSHTETTSRSDTGPADCGPPSSSSSDINSGGPAGGSE